MGCADKYAKYWLEPTQMARNRGFRSHELTELRQLIDANVALFKDKWNEHFGHQD
jgi:hypothetical protein